MEKLKQIPAQPGQKSPILVYFGTLLGKGKLNAIESVELAIPSGKFENEYKPDGRNQCYAYVFHVYPKEHTLQIRLSNTYSIG